MAIILLGLGNGWVLEQASAGKVLQEHWAPVFLGARGVVQQFDHSISSKRAGEWDSRHAHQCCLGLSAGASLPSHLCAQGIFGARWASHGR